MEVAPQPSVTLWGTVLCGCRNPAHGFETGDYQYLGGGDITALADASGVARMRVDANGEDCAVFVNGTKVGDFVAGRSSGFIGLVTSESVVTFEDIVLSSLATS